MKPIWEIFPALTLRVKAEHDRVKMVGHHDIEHALRVGNMAQLIASEEWDDERIAKLAGVAGLCHNADRLLAYSSGSRPAPEAIEALVRKWLETDISSEEADIVVAATLGHDQKNRLYDSKVQIALMDADRVTNLGMDVLFRNGQFNAHLPTIDYQHFDEAPGTTYQKPGSCVRSIAYALEWADSTRTDVCCRTRLGIAIAQYREAKIRSVLVEIKEQITMEEVFPFDWDKLAKES